MTTIILSQHADSFYARSIDEEGTIRGGFAGANIPDLKRTVKRLMDGLYPEDQSGEEPTTKRHKEEMEAARESMLAEAEVLTREADYGMKTIREVPYPEPYRSKDPRYSYVAEKRRKANELREKAATLK